MPYSFTQIEEDKTKTISLVFSSLMLFYFTVFYLLCFLFKIYFLYETSSYRRAFHFSYLSVSETVVVLGFALIIGYSHWWYTTSGLVEKILGVLKTEQLNPKDKYHQMFQNIVEEVSVATGGKNMEAVVIPTMAMNAFALADFSGRSVIGVTEGMLARLTRAQIEAVVGHEAAHIVTGDCLATTVTSSLFELYSGLLRGIEVLVGGNSGGYSSFRGKSKGRGGGGVVLFIVLIYVLLFVTKTLSQLVRLFISRQREYRADAIAVRLTRDPLSLAEALYAIQYRWRLSGLPAQELEAIFIVNPVFSAIDEQSGWWAEMFSTHPPMEARLAVLLDMAHTDAETLVKEVEQKSHKARTVLTEAKPASVQWMIRHDGNWKGPFDLVQIMTLGWLTSETWVQRVGDNNVKMAYEDSEINRMVNPQHHTGQDVYNCPKCHIPLNLIEYEGTESFQCSFCQGMLVRENDIKRVIIRQEIGFSKRIIKIAEHVRSMDHAGMFSHVINRDPQTLLQCPKCQHPKAKMMRMFYTEVYRVEIDKCLTCGFLWFDKDELEVLQYLIEAAMSDT